MSVFCYIRVPRPNNPKLANIAQPYVIMVSISNKFELLATPGSKRKRNESSSPPPPADPKKLKHTSTTPIASDSPPSRPHNSEPANLFFNIDATDFFDKLASLGDLSVQEKNQLGETLSSFLNKLGDRLATLSKENVSLRKEIDLLKQADADRLSQHQKKKGLNFRSKLISDLKTCAKTTTIVQTNLGHSANNPTNFLSNKSRSIRNGHIKPSIKVFNSSNPILKNIDLTCASILEKKQLELEFRGNGLNTRQCWPKPLINPIKTIRTRYSQVYVNNHIMVRPADACNSLNIWRRIDGGAWTFVENINLPTSKDLANTTSFYPLKSSKIQTNDIYCT